MKCPSVRLLSVHKKFFQSQQNSVQWVLHDSMPYDLIQGQGQGRRGQKVVKMAYFKVSLRRRYACYQKANGNGKLWYSKTISKFLQDRFMIFILVRCHVTFKVRLLQGFDRQSRMRLILTLIIINCNVIYRCNYRRQKYSVHIDSSQVTQPVTGNALSSLILFLPHVVFDSYHWR